MAEYLAPGVYMEETSYRAKSIQGVATSTTGFVGPCRYGPTSDLPRLVTSFDDFERHFGGLEDLIIGGSRQTNFIAYATRSFFDEGGTRLYIARAYLPLGNLETEDGFARQPTPLLAGSRFEARFQGLAGNVRIRVRGFRSADLVSDNRPQGLRNGDMVEVTNTAQPSPPRTIHPIGTGVAAPVTTVNLYWAELDNFGNVELFNETLAQNPGRTPKPVNATTRVQRVTVTVEVRVTPERTDTYSDLSTHPDSNNFIGTVLRTENIPENIEPPRDRSAWVWFRTSAYPDSIDANDSIPLLNAFLGGVGGPFTGPVWGETTLANGLDGGTLQVGDYEGSGSGNLATGLASLAEQEDIAIVAAPGSSTHGAIGQSVRNALVSHCENLRYRIAVLAAGRDLDQNGIREVRGKHDSTYAALYHPWITVTNPFAPNQRVLDLPPEGFIAGIYGRSDVLRGVHKAPANEVVRGALRFSQPIDKGTQDVLNPEGINCLRFFEGRGYRVWGARTISSDPEWQYVNVRRLFIFMEHSIDRSTQWAVFEPNNESLWLKLRKTIESFLYDVWRTGALMGKAAEEAFFVRCDRTTMSQGDLDNGRVVCLIGVAPTKPAEFVIFRIGQWTADASII